MVIQTFTATADATNSNASVDPCARTVWIIRNIDFLKLHDYGNVVVPIITELNSSAMQTVVKRLEEHNPRRAMVVPLKPFNAPRNNEMCATPDAIRGFLGDQIPLVQAENRMLAISISEPKRPVAYFWGLHDFVRGLRGALLGHEYLTSIGILHRDISENNIVLDLYPWQERGYLIDFDTATLQKAEKPTRAPSTQPSNHVQQPGENTSTLTSKLDEKKHEKEPRTGTFPYLSSGVLLGKRHTHFDDVESFLYVLLLFFFSYAGPLSKTELKDAHESGFVRPIGSGRLAHMRSWPKKYADWADGDPMAVAESKIFYIWFPRGIDYLVGADDFQNCLKNSWPEDLHPSICDLLRSTFMAFQRSMQGTLENRVELSHGEFITILDNWLNTYSALEQEYSNCPFETVR